MEAINNRQLNFGLIKYFTEKLDYLNDEEKKIINKFGFRAYGDLKDLYGINECIVNGTEIYESRDVTYKKKENSCELILKEGTLELKTYRLKEIVTGFIDILDDTLPLGTVVRLKKEYLGKLVNNSDIKEAEFVIVNRFIFKDGIKAYFPYAAVIYPVGFAGLNKTIQFSSALIEDVVHMGYKEEKDEVYTFMLKKELIIDKGMCSFGFASKEDRDKYNELIKGEGND